MKPQINFIIQSFALIYSIELIELGIDVEVNESTQYNVSVVFYHFRMFECYEKQKLPFLCNVLVCADLDTNVLVRIYWEFPKWFECKPNEAHPQLLCRN